MSRSAFLLLFALALPAAAQEATTTILIPTLYNGGGAFGSQWWSSVVLTNRSARPLASPGVTFGVQCFIPEGCESSTVSPGAFATIIAPRPANGLLLHLPADVAAKTSFHAQFGNGSAFFMNPTELPIVREDRFTREPIHLPDVGLHGFPTLFRTSLRLYGIDALPGTAVRVEVRPWYLPGDQWPVLASRVVTLDVPPQPANVSRAIYPAFAQLALQQEFPFEQLGGSAFAITIVPLPLPSGELPRIWAFLSTTDNATQHVTIQQPQ
jgi:hypothetical protein